MDIIIFIGLLILCILGIILISYCYFYLATMRLFYNNTKKEGKLILPHNKYIYFKHKDSDGIGIIYNASNDEETPIFYAACIYNDKSIQHLKLNEIDNYKFIDRNESKNKLH